MDLSKYIGSQIKKIRESHGLDQQQLADKIGTSRVSITRYENGARKANQDVLFKIAQLFNVSINYFFPLPKNTTIIDENHLRQVPLVGTIACGTPTLAEQNIESYIPMYFDSGNKNDIVFALTCKGKSMEPTLKNGDIVLIKQQSVVEDGEIAAVLVDDDEEATLKRIKHVGDQILLMPDNTNEFSPIILNKENPGRILGRVFEIRRKM